MLIWCYCCCPHTALFCIILEFIFTITTGKNKRDISLNLLHILCIVFFCALREYICIRECICTMQCNEIECALKHLYMSKFQILPADGNTDKPFGSICLRIISSLRFDSLFIFRFILKCSSAWYYCI